MNDERLIAAYNDRKKYPTIQLICSEFGISRRTVGRRIKKARELGKDIALRALPNSRYVDADTLVGMYNDINSFPTIASIAEYIGISPKSVKNRISILRKKRDDISSRQSVSVEEVTKKKKRIDIIDGHIKRYESVVDRPADYYLITTALNGSLAFPPALKNILAYKKYIEKNFGSCELIILPSKYYYSRDMAFAEWDSRIESYMMSGRRIIHKDLEIAADVDVVATASIPVNGWAGLTGRRSTIIPHPRLQERMVGGLDGVRKLIQTTGVITEPNYTRSRAGAGGKFHHCYGFVVAETGGETFHTRQVPIENDGSFYDLGFRVENEKVKKNISTCVANVFGDMHLANSDGVALNAAIKVAKITKPDYVMGHDVFDAHSINHHESKNPFNSSPSYLPIDIEISGAITAISAIQKKVDAEIVIVNSNHDDMVDRWLSSADWRKDVRYENREFYLQESLATFKGERPNGVAAYYFDQIDGVRALALGESFKPLNHELGIHGHKGLNGSRGSPNQYAINMIDKTITGHTHVRFRRDSTLNCGCLCKLEQGYVMKSGNISSWTHGLSIEYRSGKATNIEIKGGKFSHMW